MKQQRLIWYLIIIGLGVVLLAGTLVIKQRSKTGLIPTKSSNRGEVGLEFAQLGFGNKVVFGDEFDLGLVKPSFSRERLGRADPFQLLPGEAVNQIENLTAIDDDLEIKPEYSVRGIMLGERVTALVEENGVYRRVVAGDLFNGGRIIRITENSVILDRNGVQTIIKMGE